jgi:uncharacterized protein involved in outer membrane biogenesis
VQETALEAMRKPIIAGAAVLIGLVVLTALNVDSLVERNKDFLLGKLARTLGHPATADRIQLSFTPLALSLTNFSLGADASTSLIQAKTIQIELSLLPLFLGQFHPAKIIAEAPTITILRGADGSYNYEPRHSERNQAPTGSRPGQKASSHNRLFAIPALQISNGTLRYRDDKNNGAISVTQIKLNVSHVAIDEPLEIHFAAAVMSAQPNVNLSSRIGPIAGVADYRDYPIAGELAAEQLDLGKVNQALPQFRRALPRHLRFDGVYDIKDLKFKGTLNRPALKGAVKGSDASFRFE